MRVGKEYAEPLFQLRERAPYRGDAEIRAEVERAVVLSVARERESRKRRKRLDAQKEKVFVVLFERVVAGLPALDELALENHRLGVAARVEELEIGDAVHERGYLGARRARLVGIHEILPHPAPEVDGLPDVYDVAEGVLHDVHAARLGQPAYFFL